MANILVVISTVRPSRVGHKIAEWAAAIGRSAVPHHNLEVVDLKQYPLPPDIEPHIPIAGKGYVSPEVQRWSEKVSSSDAFVFVTAQYNWGYPGTLKIALDHLYKEWNRKPAFIISYGGRGGNLASGQLRQVLQALKVKTLDQAPELKIPRDLIEKNTGDIDTEAVFAGHTEEVHSAFQALGKALIPETKEQ